MSMILFECIMAHTSKKKNKNKKTPSVKYNKGGRDSFGEWLNKKQDESSRE